MERKTLLIFMILAILLTYVSCVGKGGGRRYVKKVQNSIDLEGKKVVPDDNFVDDPIDVEDGKVELTNIMDPYSGSYKSKITISKNFSGQLILSGINFAVLKKKEKIIYARFKFGKNLESKVVQGVIARSSGLTSGSSIDAVVIDLYKKDFSNLLLPYDLFDYRDYSKNPGIVDSPISSDLYCRGLDISYDPTFFPAVDRQTCNYEGAICLYTYAKVIDSLLYKDGLTAIPTKQQLDYSGLGYSIDMLSNNVEKCLPDNLDTANFEKLLNISGVTNLFFDKIIQVGSDNYLYKGPYRTTGKTNWSISGEALFGKFGLFEKSISNDLDPDKGYLSYLFPRATINDQKANIEHFSSTSMFTPRTITKLVSNGKSGYMDGCNKRVSNPDISTCNISAEVELISYDDLGKVQVHASSKELKIQLISDFDGPISSKKCANDSDCGGEECCYNSKCWGKDLVGGMCKGDMIDEGNKLTGETCNNDLECSSLCCNDITKKCNPHSSDSSAGVSCNKSLGQTCITRELCKQVTVNTCMIVKKGVSNLGEKLCALQCYNMPTLPDCKNGVCVAPPVPWVPDFDPSNPDCSQAVGPPEL